ncbi:MAG: tRNA (adenosine(37)-N6)-threonylcarbamoyltransferase complex transferase subunit TsaD [Candidatus Pacebacteria bacterium]|nr:tRNA (adenosine(37)-N6)-threonylcarbamoyltransferase complex transferase subunit TsaD [Candidatus Paceibacterota bacterium]
MIILSIETSCDETALSLVSLHKGDKNIKVLSDLVISQIETHAPYGGVFPALAKREHAKNLVPILRQAVKESKIESTHQHYDEEGVATILEREPELFQDLHEYLSTNGIPHIDMIMVTYGPGLAPALWVGVNFARALSIICDAPIVPVNHMEGHITSILLKEDYLNQEKAFSPLETFDFPLIALLISGGHTQLVLVKNWGEYEIIGETIDDAVGEAFDKVARLLGMEYPGGPKISQAAHGGVPDKSISLPRPMLNSGDYRFSFSGLKTAVRYLVDDLKKQHDGTLPDQIISNVAREFEDAVTEVLIKKTEKALVDYNAQGLIIAGGVSANTFITESFKIIAENHGIPLYLPLKKLSGDNSLMIASAGVINYWNKGAESYIPESELKAVGNLKLGK